MPKLDTDPYFKVAFGGAEEAAKEIGGTATQVAPSQATAEAQIEFINSLVSQKVGVIAIAGNDANAVAPALKRAVQLRRPHGAQAHPRTGAVFVSDSDNHRVIRLE